jgi:hypothetical protein
VRLLQPSFSSRGAALSTGVRDALQLRGTGASVYSMAVGAFVRHEDTVSARIVRLLNARATGVYKRPKEPSR